jgi:hypothetical protein
MDVEGGYLGGDKVDEGDGVVLGHDLIVVDVIEQGRVVVTFVVVDDPAVAPVAVYKIGVLFFNRVVVCILAAIVEVALSFYGGEVEVFSVVGGGGEKCRIGCLMG